MSAAVIQPVKIIIDGNPETGSTPVNEGDWDFIKSQNTLQLTFKGANVAILKLFLSPPPS